MKACPSCGSDNVYIHDRGWKYYLRLLIANSRMVCRECRTTWKRGSPEKFAKLKRKSYRKRKHQQKDYQLVEPKLAENFLKAHEVSSILSDLQEKKQLFVCLDLSETKEITHDNMQNLMKIFRRLQTLGGDLVVKNASREITQILVAYNLSYLIATNQKIVTGTP